MSGKLAPDPEGDSRMASSSEGSGDDLDAMFPEANEPSTTTQTFHAPNIQNLQQFPEPSPPFSDPNDSQTLGAESMDQTNGPESQTLHEALGGGSSLDAHQQQLSIAEREPGASWNTRKQQDEEARVNEQLLDRGFSLSKHV
ncbi:MAG: hypothetical protein L6R39_007325 [Caloplaca ligustica]|nr:MAG: hypothetical protein L6R39_007325 [Caloplaca ligustica]